MNAAVKGRSRETDMTKGSPLRLIFGFAMPLLVGNVFQQLYNTVDSIVVGHAIGKHALAGVSAGFPFMMTLYSIFIGAGMAATILIAQAYGAQRLDRVQLTVSTIYKAMMIASIPLTLIGFFAARPMLVLMNVPDDGTLTMATQYLQIIFLGVIGTVGYNLNNGILQGIGDSMTSVRFLIIASIINIVLDIVLVVGFHMGVSGAALATIIAQMVSWISGLRFINRNFDFMKIKFRQLRFDTRIFREALRLGIPSALQNALFSIGAIAVNAQINSFGTDFMAGYNGAGKIDAFVFLPILSFSNATTAYTGQNAGAGKLERIQEGRRASLLLCIGTSVLISALLFPTATFAMRLFSQDPQVIEVGRWYLQEVLPFYPLLASLFIHNALLRGIGKMTVPLVTSLVALWFARVPAVYWLSATFGPQYLFFAYGIGWLIGLSISMTYYYVGNWRKDIPKLVRAEQVE